MKKLETVTEYQLLYLAKQELSRRVRKCEIQIAEGQTERSLRRIETLLEMYYEQESEILNRMGEINNEMQNNTGNYIVEFCPHCDTENEIRWDVETEGYEAFCPRCGKRIMICSECMSAEDNELQKCDWFEGKCFRCKSNKLVIYRSE